MTVAELHEVARQVGIPSEALSRALSEVARASAKHQASPQGWLHHRETSFIAGHIPDEDLAWLIRLLDQLGQIEGTVRYEEGALRWRSPSGLYLEVLNRPQETHVSVEARDFADITKAGVALIGMGLIVGMVGARLMNAGFPVLLGGAAGGLSFGVYWKLRVEKLRNTIAKTSKGIAEVLRMVIRRETDEG